MRPGSHFGVCRRLCAVCALALWIGPHGSAFAETPPRWELGVGAYALAVPDYRGADEYSGYLLPFPYIEYRGERLRVDREGGHLQLLRERQVTVDISLAAAPPVSSEDNAARAGMPDLDPIVELGPELQIWLRGDRRAARSTSLVLPLRVAIATDLRQAQSAGWVLAPHVKLRWRGAWDTSLSVGPLFATEAYHDYFYELAPRFAGPGRPAFDARAGYSGSRLTLVTSRRMGRFWVGGFLRFDTLAGSDVTDSGLVRETTAWTAGFGIARVLGSSAKPAGIAWAEQGDRALRAPR